MTSAHRPTFVHAIAREKQGRSHIKHERALSGHKRVKTRASGESSEVRDKDREFEAVSDSEKEPDGDKILVEKDGNETSDVESESDDEEDLLRELENLKQSQPSQDAHQVTKQQTAVSKVEKPSWRNKKRQRSIKSVKNDGNDMLKSHQHAKFMDKYVR